MSERLSAERLERIEQAMDVIGQALACAEDADEHAAETICKLANISMAFVRDAIGALPRPTQPKSMPPARRLEVVALERGLQRAA